MLDQVLLRTCTFENHWLVGYNQPLWRTLRGNEVYLIHNTSRRYTYVKLHGIQRNLITLDSGPILLINPLSSW